VLITNLERLALICQHLRSHRFETVEELKEELEPALTAILGTLKYLRERSHDHDIGSD